MRLRRLTHVLITRVCVALAALAVLAGGVVVTSTAASAAPAYTRMSATELSYARDVLATMNQQRAAHGRKPLRFNATLSVAAAAHNRAMAAVNVIAHQLRGERNFVARGRTAGWKTNCASAENLGVNPDMSRGGAVELQLMMYREVAPNDGHRVNTLNRRYTDAGVAVLLDPRNGRLWLTVDFGQRRC